MMERRRLAIEAWRTAMGDRNIHNFYTQQADRWENEWESKWKWNLLASHDFFFLLLDSFAHDAKI